MKKPEVGISVFAKIDQQTSLGLSSWYEVIYHDGVAWRAFAGSNTFCDGERVVAWKYSSDCGI